jgi:hypothetical protein
MRILFVAYCIVNENGDSLTAVYRKALATALEMAARGHDIWMFCPGRRDYLDDSTYEAEVSIRFLDFPQRMLGSPRTEFRRRCYRMALRNLRPDLIVMGESPLRGTLLDVTECAVNAGIRLVLFENAYSPRHSRVFVARSQSKFDGIVLAGPSSLQMRRPPERYCAAPPYLEGSTLEAETLLSRSGQQPERWITVVADDPRVLQLAAPLLDRLPEHDCGAVVVTSGAPECKRIVGALTPKVAERILVLPRASDNLLFGLLRVSSLVIGKCDFALVSECLASRTPFLGLKYPGCFPVSLLPRRASRFVHVRDAQSIYPGTERVAWRFLHTPRADVPSLHDGSVGARSMVADFLEMLASPGAKPGENPDFRGSRWMQSAMQVFSGGRSFLRRS